MPQIRDFLPELYRELLGDPLAEEVPPETKATCSSCAMLEGGCHAANSVAPIDGRPRFFRADTKCCTFHPRLPNYLVGAILASDDPALAEGRRRVSARVASRVGVTPGWLHPPRKFTLLYDSALHRRGAGVGGPRPTPGRGARRLLGRGVLLELYRHRVLTPPPRP